MVREIAFCLSVTPLTSKIYSYFKLQVDNDTAWTTELIPGSAKKFIGFRTNFLSSSSNVLILLYGAKVEFGVVKDAERISSAAIDISNWRDGDEMEVVFWIENLKVATMRASAKVFILIVRYLIERRYCVAVKMERRSPVFVFLTDILIS